MLRVLRKEIREALRDRNLVVQLVLVPLFLYPLLGFGAWQAWMVVQGAEEGRVDLAWVDPGLDPALRARLVELADTRWEPPRVALARRPAASFRAVRDTMPGPPAVALLRVAGEDSVLLLLDGARERSRDLASRVAATVVAHRDSLRRAHATAAGLGAGGLELVHVVRIDTASARQAGRYILSLLLPVILLLMLAQGCTYATLDSIVGERERGTWETLLGSPLPRDTIIAGKLATITLWSVVAFALNLLGMMVFLHFALDVAGLAGRLELGLDPSALAWMVGVALLTGALLAATMALVALPCRNYREGQASLTPVLLLVVFVPLAVLQASEGFGYGLALVPLVNVAGLLRAAVRGDLPAGPALACVAEMALLAWLAVRLAGRVLHDEEALLSPATGLKARFRQLRGGR